MSCQYFNLRHSGGAPLAPYKNRSTGRCFSFTGMTAVPETSPSPADWLGLQHTL